MPLKPTASMVCLLFRGTAFGKKIDFRKLFYKKGGFFIKRWRLRKKKTAKASKKEGKKNSRNVQRI